jgi:putative oxidoreductase
MLGRLIEDLPKPHIHLASFLLRLGLAAIFIFHGYLKISLDYGRGWDAELPEGTQMAVAWGELACGLAMLFGLLSRLAAIGIIVIQVGAISLYTWRYDFIHIEYNANDPHRIPTGTEYNCALIIMALAVLAIGSGKVSIDHLLFGRRQRGVVSPVPAAPARVPVS